MTASTKSVLAEVLGELEALVALEGEATAAPWSVAPRGASDVPCAVSEYSEKEQDGHQIKVANWIAEFDIQNEDERDEDEPYQQDEANAYLVVAARNKLPSLLSALAEARGLLEEAERHLSPDFSCGDRADERCTGCRIRAALGRG